jgi:hypothetical protein
MSGNMLNNTMSSILGGGIPGSQPKHGLIGGGANANAGSGMTGGGERSLERTLLRNAYGNKWLTASIRSPGYFVNSQTSKVTPFRAIMSAGDVNGSVNSAISSVMPAINQVSYARIQGTQNRTGAPLNNGKSYYAGNPKYVYDSSIYTRFKKLKNENKNYDDKSFGGSNNGAYVYLKRVRRG